MAVVESFMQESMYGLSAQKSGRCRGVAVVERFKQESVYGLSAQKSGRSREVAVIGGSTVFGSEAWGNKTKEIFSPKPRSQV